jgi:hypothetical protein
MRITHAGVALITALAVAACGGSGGSSDTSNGGDTSTGGATATVTRTITPTNSTATASGTTTGATASSSGGGSVSGGSGAGHQCTAATLALSYLGGQGATGHGELGFALRNTGMTACATGGYPGILFLDRHGAALPTVPTHTTSDFFGHTTLKALTLAPGQSASFRLGVTHIATGAGACTTAYSLQAIAPNDTATLRVAIPGGAAECAGATVSPLQAGFSAYQ